MPILEDLPADGFSPSLVDVPVLGEFPIRVAFIACFLLLTDIALFYARKKRLVAGSEADAVHESFRRATSREFRGGYEIDVPELVFN